MNQELDQRHRFSDLLERRKWMRFSSGDIDVWVPPGPVKARVVDESFGGIGLVVADASGLTSGTKITLIYNGGPMWAVVRHVAPDEGGKHRLGLQWTGSDSSERAVHRCESRALSAQAAEPAAAPSTEDASWFVEEVPAGVRKMWDLFENQRWDDLVRTTSHLKQVAAFLGFDQIAADTNHLHEVIEQGAPKAQVQTALETVIEACTRICLAEQARKLRNDDDAAS